MKQFLLVWTLVTATGAIAQALGGPPSCALTCLESSVKTTDCKSQDYVCQCTTGKTALTNAAITCLSASKCSITEIKTTQAWTAALCDKVLAASSAAPTTLNSSTTGSPLVSSSNVAPTDGASTVSIINVETFGAKTPGTTWGTESTSDGKANRGPAFEALSIACFLVSCVAVAFRFFARLQTKRLRQVSMGLWADEYFALLALVLTGGVTGSMIAGVQSGWGKHLGRQTEADLMTAIKVTYSFIILSTLCLFALKISVLCLYLRMTPKKQHQWTIYGCMAVITAHCIAAAFGAIFSCRPISTYWDTSISALASRNCIDILGFNMWNSAFGVFEDIVIWLLPIPVIWRLQVHSSKKAGLYGLIAVSGISVLCSILRLSTMVLRIQSSDISWNFPLIPLSTTMEACVALVTSSVPAVYPLFRKAPPNNAQGRAKSLPSKDWQSEDISYPKSSFDGMKPSRWSFLSWPGSARKSWPTPKRNRSVEVEVFGKELKNVNEEPSSVQPSMMVSLVAEVESAQAEVRKTEYWIRRKSDSESQIGIAD